MMRVVGPLTGVFPPSAYGSLSLSRRRLTANDDFQFLGALTFGRSWGPSWGFNSGFSWKLEPPTTPPASKVAPDGAHLRSAAAVGVEARGRARSCAR